MSEASLNDNTTRAAEATPSVDIPALEEGLTSVADLLREIRMVTSWAILGESDPAAALAQLEQAGEVHWAAPPLLPALHDALVDLMNRRVQVLAGDQVEFEGVSRTRLEIDRVNAFRRAPGHWVPNAKHAKGLTSIGPQAVDGFLDIAGEVCPWIYDAVGVSTWGVFELTQSMKGLGFDRGYVVGTHVREGVVLPDNVTFVEMQ